MTDMDNQNEQDIKAVPPKTKEETPQAKPAVKKPRVVKEPKPKADEAVLSPEKPKAKRGRKPKEPDLPPISYDGEDQMSFAKAATIIEDAMEAQGDFDDEDNLETEKQSPVRESESDLHTHHIQVTHGETVEATDDQSFVPKPPPKKVSKAALKKANGTAVSRPIKEKPSRKQRRTMILGVFLSFFVLVGVGSTIFGAVTVTKNIVTSSSLKKELSRVIFPLVIIDTPEFDNPTKLDNSAIISSAIWAFIIDEKDKSKYRTDDLGSIFVPDVDVELYVRQLFGSEVKINHQSVDDASVQMAYSPESKTYIIEATPKFLPYTPRVDSVKKTGDIYTLQVGYILPTVLWNLDRQIDKQIPDKIMEYKLQKKDDTYQVLSVSLISIATVPEGTKQESVPELQEEVPGEGIVDPEEIGSSTTVSEADADTASAETNEES